SPSYDRAVGFERQTVPASCGDFCETCSRGDIRNYLGSPTDNSSRSAICVLRLGLWNVCYRHCRQTKKCFQFHIHTWLSWQAVTPIFFWNGERETQDPKFRKNVTYWVRAR